MEVKPPGGAAPATATMQLQPPAAHMADVGPI
jgi:hypothetical protein